MPNTRVTMHNISRRFLFELSYYSYRIYIGTLAFETEYARWLEEHNKLINELRVALNAHAGDDDLRHTVDSIMAHHHESFRLKGAAARADAFHVLSGMWKTPVERYFLWLGGFRPSELLKVSDLSHTLCMDVFLLKFNIFFSNYDSFYHSYLQVI
jgi:hypothetical protein